ncbi:MAG: hypothetical protein JJU15_01430 [Pararhodobacter sp.]|nr:hypothetical protein [Pararhodobacter sp.]
MQNLVRFRVRLGAGAALGLVLMLAGCATPLEQCVASATTEVRYLEEELTERRVNIARGYAVQREMRPDFQPGFCYSPHYGMRLSIMCMEPVQTVHETRRPINVSDEEARIALLERALTRERQLAAQATERCRAQYPPG